MDGAVSVFWIGGAATLKEAAVLDSLSVNNLQMELCRKYEFGNQMTYGKRYDRILLE